MYEGSVMQSGKTIMHISIYLANQSLIFFYLLSFAEWSPFDCKYLPRQDCITCRNSASYHRPPCQEYNAACRAACFARGTWGLDFCSRNILLDMHRPRCLIKFRNLV